MAVSVTNKCKPAPLLAFIKLCVCLTFEKSSQDIFVQALDEFLRSFNLLLKLRYIGWLDPTRCTCPFHPEYKETAECLTKL
jgi:hypothetical protein